MFDLVRDSAAGQCLRFCSGNRIGTFADEAVPSNIDGPDEKPIAEDDIENKFALVTWYSDDDPDNPHNWSSGKKIWVSTLILTYTFAVYIGSSLYTASVPDVTEVFNVSDTASLAGLSLYVVGYGIGPMLFSPLSEIPAVGRMPLFVVTFFIFVILCIPTALVNNFGGLLVLRLLLGVFGSPGLATGGAAYGDYVGGTGMPYAIAVWGGGATVAPALGPLVGGFAVQAKGWRWSSWELLWLCGPMWILMFFTLPETSSATILRKRARRLRAITGRDDWRSQSEIDQAQLSLGPVVFDALIKPWEINAKDPAVLFSTVYTALIYGIYYSFFESFPLVYQDIYGFNLGELGLAFIAVLIGLIVAVVVYCAYFYFIGDPKMAKMEPGTVPPEARLWPGLVATFFIPVGLFIFAWTARADIHWIASLVGVGISMFGVFIITQCMFIYLPFIYPKYSGSLFAANGLARSCFAAGAILYAGPMFDRLGVDGGVSLLGGLTALCCFGIYAIYFLGAKLRKRSRFAGT